MLPTHFGAQAYLATHVCERYKVAEIGRIDSVVEHLYAITTERRLAHPAIAVGAAGRVRRNQALVHEQQFAGATIVRCGLSA